MRRARWIAAAVIGWTVCTTISLLAQAPPDGWVVLSLDEYRDLRARSQRAGLPPPLPADATVSRVDYELRLDGEAVTGHALLTVDVLRDGWARIPIPAGLTVTNARLDGQPVALADGPPPYLVLSRPGRTRIELDIVIPLTASAGTESISLPAAPVPVTRATLLLARGGLDLSVAGGFVSERASTADESQWTVYGHPNEPLKLAWKRRIDDRRASLPLRVRARLHQFVSYAEDGCHLSVSVQTEVVQGSMQDVVLTLPDEVVVNEVNGPTVADWEAADGRLRVRLLEPVITDVAFVVVAEMRSEREGDMAVPILRLPSAERESGGVAVDIVGAGEIVTGTVRGLEPADSTELGEFLAAHDSPSLVGFRLRPIEGSEPRSLGVSVVRFAPQAVLVANVEEVRYSMLVTEQRTLVEARYAIRNNQRSFLKVVLPPGATVWSAVVDGRPIRPGLAEQDAVLLPLGKARVDEDAPASVVKLVYLQPESSLTDTRLTLQLPSVDLPISRSGLRLYYPPTLRVESEDGTFRPASDSGPFSAALRMSAAPAVARRYEVGSANAGLQGLVERYRSESGERRVMGALPVDISVPVWGPSVFLASELTPEGQPVVVAFKVKHVRQ